MKSAEFSLVQLQWILKNSGKYFVKMPEGTDTILYIYVYI